jgi:hypothetical protein
MKDMQAHMEKLRAEAADCRLVSDLATEVEKRELFLRLSKHLDVLASEIAKAIDAQNAEPG